MQQSLFRFWTPVAEFTFYHNKLDVTNATKNLKKEKQMLCIVNQYFQSDNAHFDYKTLFYYEI